MKTSPPARDVAAASVGAFAGICALAAIARATHNPYIFPSLGATAFLLFGSPQVPAARARNTVIGHAAGIAFGYLALVIFRLTNTGSAIAVGVTGPRILAAGLSVGLTTGFLVLLDSPHPPAGASTLIVSLGLIRKPHDLVIMMAAVLVLVVLGEVLRPLLRGQLPRPLARNAAARPEPDV